MKYELTERHRKELKPWADRWIANAMSTKQMDDEEKEITKKAILGIYAAAKLPAPKKIVFVSSPLTMTFAGGFAAAIIHKKNATTDDNCDATDDATRDATYAATYTETHDATIAAKRAATDAATRAATDAVTYDTTESVTSARCRDATLAAIRSATRVASRDETYTATHDATDAATYAATDAATYAATDAATYAATYNSTYTCDLGAIVQLSADLGLGKLGFKCADFFGSNRQGGNQWATWESFISFFRHIAELDLDYSKWDHWEKAAMHSGPRIMHKDFCIVSDRPETLLVDDDQRPHCDTGPFCRWRDGTAIYALHGVFVPAWVIETPKDQIDPKKVLAIENVN